MTLTGRTRHRLGYFGRLVLQVEKEHEVVLGDNRDGMTIDTEMRKDWFDATVPELTWLVKTFRVDA